MQDKAVRARAPASALRVVFTTAVNFTMGRTPTEDQLVVIELAGDMLLATITVRRMTLCIGGGGNRENQDEECSCKRCNCVIAVHRLVLPCPVTQGIAMARLMARLSGLECVYNRYGAVANKLIAGQIQF